MIGKFIRYRFQLFMIVLFILCVMFRLMVHLYFPKGLLTNNISYHFPLVTYYLFSLVNTILLYKIGKKLLNSQIGLISTLIYLIIPWVFYLEVIESLYLGYLTVLLFIINYLYPKKAFVYVFLLSVLMIVFTFIKKDNLFQNIGIVNTINVFRGEAQQEGFGFLSRLIENKPSFYLQDLIMRAVNVFNPVIYFTPEARYAPYIFTPPIWTGFLIFFLVGLKSLVLAFFLWNNFYLVNI